MHVNFHVLTLWGKSDFLFKSNLLELRSYDFFCFHIWCSPVIGLSRGMNRYSRKTSAGATWASPRGRVFPKSRHSATCDPLDARRCTLGSPNGCTRQGDGWGLSHTRIRGARDIARAPPGGLNLGERANGAHTTRGPLAHNGWQWGPILGCITDHGRWPCRHVAHVAGLGSFTIGIR